MRRRAFLSAGAVASVAWPYRAYSQQNTMSKMCFLTYESGRPEAPSPRFRGFFQRLRELGYVHGESFAIDYIAAEGRTDQYDMLAAKCVRGHPDVIAVSTTPGAVALKRATSTIPIVMVALGDPQGTGLVADLAKPGGNITGTSPMTSGLAAKRLELLKEAVPTISKVLVLTYSADPISPLQVRAMQDVAPKLGLTLLVHDIRSLNEIPAAFALAVRQGADAMTATSESIFRAARERVTGLATNYRLPSIYPFDAFVTESNGMMAYEVSGPELQHRAAEYVDKVLHRHAPAALPVQQPTTIRLVVSLKAANALGLQLPPGILARAHEVIE